MASSASKDPEKGTSTETTPLVSGSSTEVEGDKIDFPEPHSHTVVEDVLDTLKLGVPIFIAMLSWVGVS
jgi:hypothetical protein